MNDMNRDRDSSKKIYITGIFNYCDRWCERCQFTCRCRNFTLGEALRKAEKQGDDINRVFWDQLADLEPEDNTDEIWEEGEILEEEVNEPLFPEVEDDDELLDRETENHPCAELADRYMAAVDTWRKSSGIVKFSEEGRITIDTGQAEVSHESCNISISPDEAFEVIWWYHRFIYVKIMRAVRGNDEDCFEDPDIPCDSDGTAKIVLIAIGRSLAAWNIMLHFFGNKKTSISPFIDKLTVLRRKVEEIFPDAWAFDRPGFDTECD
jgi:hypothetical protein